MDNLATSCGSSNVDKLAIGGGNSNVDNLANDGGPVTTLIWKLGY